MAKAAPDDQAAPRGKGQPRAYARAYTPSWIDRFTASVERLPGPSESYYLGIGLIVLLVGLAVLWGEGAVPAGQLYPIHAYLAVTVAYLPVLICYLDRRAGAALAAMRPLLEVSDQECDDLHYQLTTLSAWPTLLAGLVVFLLPLLVDESRRVAGQPGVFSELGVSTVSYWFMYVLYRLVWWVFGTFIYHTCHQLRLINRIYTEHTRVNLFRVGPLYAFSSVTALTAVGLVIPPYGFVALIPGALADPIAVAYMLPITALALVAFVWPLLGIHKLLADEKARLLDEHAMRFEATIAQLHQRVDNGELDGLESLDTALSTLETGRDALNDIPTWPWHPETVRLLFTALALPLSLWVAQYVLQRVLGP